MKLKLQNVTLKTVKVIASLELTEFWQYYTQRSAIDFKKLIHKL